MNVLSRAFKRACPGKIAVGLMGVVAAVFCNGPIARFIDFPASHEPSRSIVVVTGCDSGFGKYMALKLASLGYVVVSTCMTQEGAKDIEAKVAEVIVCDLTLEESISRLGVAVHKLLAVNEQLSLWAVVNNAGVAPVGFVDWVSMDSFRFSMEVNYFALVAVCKEFLPLLKASKGSRIINLGSMAGLATCPAMSSYAASKHAVEGFAKSLRAELRPFGVGVCNVNPGFMQTPLISNSVSAAEKTFREAVKNDEALGRLYTSEIIENTQKMVLTMQENPHKVGDYIVDYLVPARNPPFTNFVGLQAAAGRWLIMLPKQLQEFMSAIFMPLRGVSADEINRIQS